MSLRRIVLAGMLIALATCALLGMIAALFSNSRDVFSLLFAGIALAVGFGIMLPLTFLVDRPTFRAGGIAGIVVIGIFLGDVLAMVATSIADFRNFGVYAALSMIMGMTLMAGIPAAAGLMLVQFRWAKAAAWGLASVAGLAWVLAAVGGVIAATELSSDVSGRIFGVAMVTLGMGFVISLLLVNVGCGDRRHFRWPAVAVAGAAWVAACASIAFEIENKGWLLGLVFMVVIAAFLAHLNVLLMSKLRQAQGWLVLATALVSAGCGTLLIGGIASEVELMFGGSVAAGLAAMCGTLALLVLSFFNRRINELPPVESLLKEVALTCPRCARHEVVAVGGAACGGCGLELHLRIVEPRCEKCGYLIYGVGVAKCPECGEDISHTLAAKLPPPATPPEGPQAFPVQLPPSPAGVSTNAP